MKMESFSNKGATRVNPTPKTASGERRHSGGQRLSLANDNEEWKRFYVRIIEIHQNMLWLLFPNSQINLILSDPEYVHPFLIAVLINNDCLFAYYVGLCGKRRQTQTCAAEQPAFALPRKRNPIHTGERELECSVWVQFTPLFLQQIQE